MFHFGLQEHVFTKVCKYTFLEPAPPVPEMYVSMFFMKAFVWKSKTKHVVKYDVYCGRLLMVSISKPKYGLLRSGHRINNEIFGPGSILDLDQFAPRPIRTRDPGPRPGTLDLGPRTQGPYLGPGDGDPGTWTQGR